MGNACNEINDSLEHVQVYIDTLYMKLSIIQFLTGFTPWYKGGSWTIVISHTVIYGDDEALNRTNHHANITTELYQRGIEHIRN